MNKNSMDNIPDFGEKTFYCALWPEFDFEDVEAAEEFEADSHETAASAYFIEHMDDFVYPALDDLQNDEYIIIVHDGEEWMAFVVAEIKATFECVTERVAQ